METRGKYPHGLGGKELIFGTSQKPVPHNLLFAGRCIIEHPPLAELSRRMDQKNIPSVSQHGAAGADGGGDRGRAADPAGGLDHLVKQ